MNATPRTTLTYAYTDVHGDTTTETIDFADKALAVSWAVTIRAAYGRAFDVIDPPEIAAQVRDVRSLAAE